jgi:predicted amidohydrolase
MKIYIGQYFAKEGDSQYNLNIIKNITQTAKNKECQLVCLPEMCTTGFPWNEIEQLVKITKKTINSVKELAANLEIDICGSFLDLSEKGNPKNTFYYFNSNGTVAARYSKVHLFSLFGEDKYLQAGNELVVADTSYAKIGCSICYDIRFPEVFRFCALAGAQIQFLPAAFPHPRLEQWQTLVRARAIENQNFIIAVNQSETPDSKKTNSNALYFGHSMVVGPSGDILYEAGRQAEYATVDIDLSEIEAARKSMPCRDERRVDLY